MSSLSTAICGFVNIGAISGFVFSGDSCLGELYSIIQRDLSLLRVLNC